MYEAKRPRVASPTSSEASSEDTVPAEAHANDGYDPEKRAEEDAAIRAAQAAARERPVPAVPVAISFATVGRNSACAHGDGGCASTCSAVTAAECEAEAEPETKAEEVPPDPAKGKRGKTPQRYMTPLGPRLWNGRQFLCAHDEMHGNCARKRKGNACAPFTQALEEARALGAQAEAAAGCPPDPGTGKRGKMPQRYMALLGPRLWTGREFLCAHDEEHANCAAKRGGDACAPLAQAMEEARAVRVQAEAAAGCPPDPGQGKRSETPQRYVTLLGPRLWTGKQFLCAHDEMHGNCARKRKGNACAPFTQALEEASALGAQAEAAAGCPPDPGQGKRGETPRRYMTLLGPRLWNGRRFLCAHDQTHGNCARKRGGDACAPFAQALEEARALRAQAEAAAGCPPDPGFNKRGETPRRYMTLVGPRLWNGEHFLCAHDEKHANCAKKRGGDACAPLAQDMEEARARKAQAEVAAGCPPDPGAGKRGKTRQRYLTPLGPRLWDGHEFLCAHDEHYRHCVSKRGENACEPSNLDAIENRFNEVVVWAANVNARPVIDNPEEWKRSNPRSNGPVALICLAHPDEPPITSTTVNSLQQGHFGCPKCRHKTETRLFEWLKKQHPSWRRNELKLKNPKTDGTMSVDFDNPVLRAAIELDGNIEGGHFDDDPANLTPHRDLEKEKQLLDAPHHYQVLRLLQEDVWDDKYGWENWLLGELKRWATRLGAGKPPEAARHPVRPEYLGGIYARLRGKGVAKEAEFNHEIQRLFYKLKARETEGKCVVPASLLDSDVEDE